MSRDLTHAFVGWSGISDSAMADRFAQAHQVDYRYTAAFGKWSFFDGSRWADDTTLTHVEAARNLHDTAAMDLVLDDDVPPARRARAVKELRSARAIMATLVLARSHPDLVATVQQWDADPYTLATPGSEVDLRTGKLRPSTRESYCTRVTAVTPRQEPAPVWLEFLRTVTGDNADLQAYLQRVAGYALVGEVTEHALVFLYGLGANGKSTFVNTLAAVMGDYATAAPMDTFTENQGQHPTDLAMLKGARLVTASETEDGKRWASARIKQLTGGDPISARYMRQDFFEYKPQFTLVISGNHKPGLRSVDEGTRRRLHLVPFTTTIPADKRDPNLPNALRDEWPAILGWMVDGCLAWQREGLRPPPIVTAATEAYLSDEDVLGQWLDLATEVDSTAFEVATALHEDYRVWAERSGEKFLGAKRFGQALEERGLVRHRTNTSRGFTGRRLKTLGDRPWHRRNQSTLLD